MKYQKIDTVMVLSGGLDSIVATLEMHSKGMKIKAIYLDYNKPSSENEKKAVRLICNILYIPLEIIDMSSVSSFQSGLISSTAISSMDQDMKGQVDLTLSSQSDNISNEYVGREDGAYITGYHTVLSIAAYYAQISGSNSITIGLIKEQFDAHPSLKDSLETFCKSISLFNYNVEGFKIITPFEDMTKSDVVKLGDSLGVPFEISWSCESGDLIHCGNCIQCKSRKGSFADSSISDPTSYQN